VKTSDYRKEMQEVLIYFADCPEHGREHRIFDEAVRRMAGANSSVGFSIPKFVPRSRSLLAGSTRTMVM
jgi:hypothetical protein